MAFIEELRERVEALAASASLDVESAALPGVVGALDDACLLDVLAGAAALVNDVERLRVIAAGVAAQRSSRDYGHGGLAARRGHRTPASLVQSIAGGTRAEADRHVRLGTTLLEELQKVDSQTDPVEPPTLPAWDSPLRRALLASTITASQHDAIFRGLGEPPVRDADERVAEAMREAWTIAAEQLIEEADSLPVEDLLRRARQVRDVLDPIGTEERFAQRYERRSFRTWIDVDGAHHARIDFDDEMAAWVRTMIDAALRPRRGGPRFVDPDEVVAADHLVNDPRTNEQLTYDLVMDIWRAGAVASAEDVFGARQPGVRMVVVKDAVGPRDAFGRLLATGHLEDRGDGVPGSVLDRALCRNGWMDVVVDSYGNPLDVGREQRLYTPRQRIALAVRDGGCMFPGCCVPASYCEAHHCDHWWEHGGRTDIDRGMLLCRHHHLLLHHSGWRITRAGLGRFVLHGPPGDGTTGEDAPVELVSKSAVKWAWDPPPERVGWRAA